ncbi:MAG: diphthine--ammonia ligase [Nanoarchaeota archaeon]|nr:diphthine--ammonia ligase [Nanoarchaeota archaeon]
MKLAVLFSGGKDSHLAMYKASKEHEIVCAITMKSRNSYSYMFQSLGFEYTSLQLKMQQIKQHIVQTYGEKEEELEDLKRGIQETIELYGVEGIVTGAIKSTYQASRIQKICRDLDIWCFNPLWEINEEEMLEELSSLHFEVVLLGVFGYPLTKKFVGETLNEDIIQKLLLFKEKYALSPIGEGGEYESFVLNGPLYKQSLDIKINSIREESENCVYVEDFKVFMKV